MITVERPIEPERRHSVPVCPHQPACPGADAADAEAARIRISHPEQGWSLLCNGVVTFDDTGELLPDGSTIAPHPLAIPVQVRGLEREPVTCSPTAEPGIGAPAFRSRRI